MKKFFLIVLFFGLFDARSQAVQLEIPIQKNYLNIPVELNTERQKVYFLEGKDTLTYSVIRVASGKPDYWVFKDVANLKGKTLKLKFSSKVEGINKIYQSDKFEGQDSLYKESARPQFHFSTRKGWINDPNGLVYYKGEYHLFYQHNPFEHNWENMHWGHAVSKDLLHWKELDDALFPDKLGAIFSGSAVIDKKNTSGWGKDAMIAIYTNYLGEDKQVQSIAYSQDQGRTFTKYGKNPILGGTRDPKVFWHEPTQSWVMALYKVNAVAIYTSKNLKDWTYKSETKGFYECPEFFELPIDGNLKNKKWVMMAASGTYMIGSFNGEKFTPEHGKYFYTWGTQYAAQTYNNTPDGRRVQIGWGRIEMPGMSFNQQMLFPNELSLRTTKEGVRLFCEPIKEVASLHGKGYEWKNTDSKTLNEALKNIKGDLYHGVLDVEIDKGLAVEIYYRGNPIIYYDGNFTQFNHAPYVCDGKPGSFRFQIEFLIDRSSVEAYIGKGKLFIAEALKNKTSEGLQIVGDLKIHDFKLFEMKSVWGD